MTLTAGTEGQRRLLMRLISMFVAMFGCGEGTGALGEAAADGRGDTSDGGNVTEDGGADASDGGGDAGATIGAIAWRTAIAHVAIYKADAVANTCTIVALSNPGDTVPALALPRNWGISIWVRPPVGMMEGAPGCWRVNSEGATAAATKVSGTVEFEGDWAALPTELDVNVTLNFDNGAVAEIEATEVPVPDCGFAGECP